MYNAICAYLTLYNHLYIDNCEQGDQQYHSILSKCGAVVLNMIAFPSSATGQDLIAEVKRLEDIAGQSSEHRTRSIFFEESKSPSAKVYIFEKYALF
jgi:hypothetical protein